jgi:hypothetical protein
MAALPLEMKEAAVRRGIVLPVMPPQLISQVT